jgi:hypothetical protein
VHGTIQQPGRENQNIPAIIDSLTRRGLRLAIVSPRDMAANKRQLSGYRQYIKDHPEDARRFSIRQPHELSEGQLVLVAVENNQPTVYIFSQSLTATELRQLKQYISTNPKVPDVARAADELRLPPIQPEPARPVIPAGETPYLCMRDLMQQWGYCKRGVQKLASRPDFPKPCLVLHGGRKRLWARKDIENYERDRPELHSETAKFLKVRGFARALRKGAQQPTG